MEAGADAVLVNTAIALAEDPALMAEAMAQAVHGAGARHIWRAGSRSSRMPRPVARSPILSPDGSNVSSLSERLQLYLVAIPSMSPGIS